MKYYTAWLKRNNRIVGYTRCPKDGEKYLGEKVAYGDSINDNTALHQHGEAVLVKEETAMKTDRNGHFYCEYKSFNWGSGSPIDKD